MNIYKLYLKTKSFSFFGGEIANVHQKAVVFTAVCKSLSLNVCYSESVCEGKQT